MVQGDTSQYVQDALIGLNISDANGLSSHTQLSSEKSSRTEITIKGFMRF